jgi:hypothetical protein
VSDSATSLVIDRSIPWVAYPSSMIHTSPMPAAPATPTPARQVRADFDDDTIVVYQAYAPAIAEVALAAGTFVAPFKIERMTWIKPSFLWMMYRCGWATKPGQERVLAVRMTRAGFETALSRSCLSHYDPELHASERAWSEHRERSPVRVQWDPERSLRLERLDHRAIQIGLTGTAVHSYVGEWIVTIADVTPLAHELAALVAAADLDAARALLPAERPYPLPAALAQIVGAS